MRQPDLIRYMERGWDLYVTQPTYEGDTWTCQVAAKFDGEVGADGPDEDGLDGVFISTRQADALMSKPQVVRSWTPNIYTEVYRWDKSAKP